MPAKAMQIPTVHPNTPEQCVSDVEDTYAKNQEKMEQVEALREEMANHKQRNNFRLGVG